MRNKIKLTMLALLFAMTSAFAQQDAAADKQIGEIIQVSPYDPTPSSMTKKFADINAHINGITGGIKPAEFLSWYSTFFKVFKADGQYFIGYYNPNRQTPSQIDHDLHIIRQFINSAARTIPITGIEAPPVLYTKIQ